MSQAQSCDPDVPMYSMDELETLLSSFVPRMSKGESQPKTQTKVAAPPPPSASSKSDIVVSEEDPSDSDFEFV